ncbi:unnamed protein product, partial [Darwinula stevensoni]
FYYNLARFGSTEVLGLLVGLSLVRELGPVVSALLFAGRAGTSLTAEIGLMKAGEQLSAMEMMAVDPFKRILAPRFWAGVFSMPLLTAVFSAAGIVGAWIVAVLMLGVDNGAFWGQMQNGVDWISDLGNGTIKSVVFGITVTFIALYQGYEAQPTPEGVSRATTRTVVSASLWVLALDFILTAIILTIMQQSKTDIWVGLFVLLGLTAVLFLALKSANLLKLSFEPTYTVSAKFTNIGGLNNGAAVKSAGVVVGRVKKITFDDKSFQAQVDIALEKQYAFPSDSSLLILTSGLLGEQYIGVSAGGDTTNWQQGD